LYKNRWIDKDGNEFFKADLDALAGQMYDQSKADTKSYNEMLPLGIQLAGLMDLQMKEQDEVANKKMTVQDFPTTAATYAPVGFAEDGGGVGMQQEMFPALKALQDGLPKEMPKKARELVGKAAEEEVQVLEQMLGYRDDSPFRNKSSINIYSDTIDMGQKGDGTGTPLLAVADNGDSKILKPYSGTHFFPGASMVTEVPVPVAQNGLGVLTPKGMIADSRNRMFRDMIIGADREPKYTEVTADSMLPALESALSYLQQGGYSWSQGQNNVSTIVPAKKSEYATTQSKETQKDINKRQGEINKLAKNILGNKGINDFTDEDVSILSQATLPNVENVLRDYRINRANKAQEKPGSYMTTEGFRESTAALGDKVSLQRLPVVGEYIPDVLDVTKGLGDMAAGLGAIPNNLNKGQYGQAAFNLGAPLLTGALGGLGARTTGQFANNLVNPLAGVSSKTKIKDILELSDSDAFYRVVVGDEAFNDIVESGVVRTNAATKSRSTTGIDLSNRPTAYPSFSKGNPSLDYAANNPNNYIIVSKDKSIQPSISGRHGKGTTMFPTDESGRHLSSIDSKNLSKTEKEKRAASLISSRLNALNSAVNAGIDSGLKGGHINAEYFDPSRLKPNIRFAENSMLNNSSINLHELEHAAKRGHKLIMPEEEDIVFQNIKNSRDVPKEDRDYHMYVASTPEIGANLMQFRKFVVDNKFAKHGEKITEDQFLKIWETLDESGDKYSQDAFYDVINTLKDTKSEDAISRFTKLYNTLTNVGGKNTTGIFNAKNGGKPKNNNNEITKLLGMNKYENGGKVMQNYMPVGNGKTKVHGFIDLASMIPIQTEKKELIVLPTGDLVKVNASKRHSQMSDDEVTDIVPENSYILSQFGSVDIYKSEADQIQMEVENKPYNMYGSNPTPKVKTLGDIMRKKVMKPADMARLVEQKYKIMDHDDPFTIQTNAINKHRRGDYLQAIIQLSEYDKARKGIDNSIETQLSQNNQQPPQMVASNGGKVLRAGYNVPKAFNPLDLIGSLVSTGVDAYFTNKGMKESKRNMNNQLSDINTFNTSSLGNLGARTFTGLSSLALQNPLVKPTLQSDQFISQFPSYANASYNAAFEGNRNSLYANRPEFDGSKLSMLMGERYNAQTMQAQSQLAGQLAGQRTNMFSQYLQARQNIFNANSASRTAAENATTVNQNDLFGKFGAVGTAYFDDKTNLASTVLNARAAARGQNTANQIQLGNQMAQTLNNGLAAGLQAYNSSKNSTGVGGYSTNTATRAQQKQKECNNRGGQWICEDGICFCDN